ncbi:MAG TPA: Ig-like domain-containing protein [Longimicrobiaceae bacterium]|nr:Ig-like domain-containing protein [Longimicrobiaceae bacterium]
MCFRRLLELRRRARAGIVPAALALLAPLLVSCHDAPTGAGSRVPAGNLALRLDASVPSGQEVGGVAGAFVKADHIRVSVAWQETLVLDTTVALSATGDRTDLRIPITLDKPSRDYNVQVTLLRGSDELFTGGGSVTLQPGTTTPVTIPLVPLATGIVLPDSVRTLVAPGDSTRIGGAVVFATGDTIPSLSLTWSTEDTSIARVHDDGYVVAVGEGRAKLTGRYGALSDTVGVQVRFQVLAISISPIVVLGLRPDSTVQLTATVLGPDGNPVDLPVTWTVQDTTVATIDDTGLLRGRAPGSTTVTATSGGRSAQIPVSVEQPVGSLIVTPGISQVIVGDSLVLVATAYGSDGVLTGRPVTWTSRDTVIATVSETGVVRARRAGTTFVDARVESARDSAMIRAIATPGIDPSTSVDSISETSAIVRGSATPGNVSTLVVLYWGTNADSLIHLSPSAVQLPADTLQHALRLALSDLPAGRTIFYRITASNLAGRDSTAVDSFTTALVPVATLLVSPDSAQLAVGDSLALSATAYAADESVLAGRTVTWSSADTTVATVGASGVVRAVAPGSTTIRAKTGTVGDSSRIHVIAPPALSSATAGATSTSTAKITGQYSPGGALTDVWARWGTSAAVLADSSANVETAGADGDQVYTILVSGLAPATSYYYRVGARNAAGVDSTAVQLFATPDTAPPPPGSLSAVPTGDAVYLAWQDTSARLTAFRVERSSSGSTTWDSLTTIGPGSLTYVDTTDYTGAHDYAYRVLACRTVACSQASDTVQASIDGQLRATRVAVGHAHTCAVQLATGWLYCWGANGNGQIGTGLGADVTPPTRIEPGTSFLQVAAGYNRTCALARDGTTSCWGTWGADPDSTGTAGTPQVVPGGYRFQSISVGYEHACGVTDTGAAYCWGSNHSGQLASADTTLRTSTPQPIPGTYVSISAGTAHTCAIGTDQQAYCWGSNGNGQLGIGTSDVYRTTPALVAGGHSFASISAGDQHTCAVEMTTASAYCWGSNDLGQIGNGSSGSAEYAPVAVSGGHAFSSVSAATGLSCGVDAVVGAQGLCWGTSEVGELGADNTALSYTRYAPASVVGGHGFSSVSTEFMHVCGVSTDGRVYCWGGDGDYQLGDGSTTNEPSPVEVLLRIMFGL